MFRLMGGHQQLRGVEVRVAGGLEEELRAGKKSY